VGGVDASFFDKEVVPIHLASIVGTTLWKSPIHASALPRQRCDEDMQFIVISDCTAIVVFLLWKWSWGSHFWEINWWIPTDPSNSLSADLHIYSTT